mmetsp:Transcript_31280/g.74318  ORF Transcript_31280/g.74318 Transcript_31280/m.74318 type:complete len:295 (+) Transcript_31280:912-1796(+)
MRSLTASALGGSPGPTAGGAARAPPGSSAQAGRQTRRAPRTPPLLRALTRSSTVWRPRGTKDPPAAPSTLAPWGPTACRGSLTPARSTRLQGTSLRRSWTVSAWRALSGRTAGRALHAPPTTSVPEDPPPHPARPTATLPRAARSSRPARARAATPAPRAGPAPSAPQDRGAGAGRRTRAPPTPSPSRARATRATARASTATWASPAPRAPCALRGPGASAGSRTRARTSRPLPPRATTSPPASATRGTRGWMAGRARSAQQARTRRARARGLAWDATRGHTRPRRARRIHPRA